MRTPPASLFLLALPRSLSSLTALAATRALGLRQPCWTSDGEILNRERYWPQLAAAAPPVEKFLLPSRRPTAVQRLHTFLDEVVEPRGYLYKEVVQPFVFAEWLLRRSRGGSVPRILKLERPIADIAFAMLRRGWHYPAFAAPGAAPESLAAALVAGLVRARKALSRLPGQGISFDQLIHRDGALETALATLYPRRSIRRVTLLHPDFEERREEVLRRRSTAAYQRLENLVTAAEAMVE